MAFKAVKKGIDVKYSQKYIKIDSIASHTKYNLAYTEWGNPENPSIVFCVHGLTRNSRDYDFLADVLSKDYRVICPDVVGRGKSNWSDDASFYDYPYYVADMEKMLELLGIKSVIWIGTSMGGIIGMLLAALRPDMVSKLVLNDIGPYLPAQPLKRLRKHLTYEYRFTSFDEARLYMHRFLAPCGIDTPEHWEYIIENSLTQDKDGFYIPCYDPRLAYSFGKEEIDITEVDLWHVWSRILCPVFAIRGGISEIFSEETLERMMKSSKNMQSITIPHVGHAPSLVDYRTITPIYNWSASRC